MASSEPRLMTVLGRAATVFQRGSTSYVEPGETRTAIPVLWRVAREGKCSPRFGHPIPRSRSSAQ